MNAYEILGLPNNCQDAELIRKQYRNLAKKYHPDVSDDPDAAEKFRQATEAYETLTGKNKKTSHYEEDWGNSPFGDIFSSFFGGGGKRQQHQTRKEYYAECTISFLEAAHGKTSSITVEIDKNCVDCQGNKGETKPCPNCKDGYVTFRQGNFSIKQGCSSCNQTGKIVSKPCKTCNGKGITKEPVNYNVDIPAGIRDNNVIRLREKDKDILIKVSVSGHSLFQRDEDDLIIFASISYTEAVFGTTLELPVLDGKHKVTIPPQTKSGDHVRIPKKGFSTQNNTGDLVVLIEIDFCGVEDKEVMDLLNKLSVLESKYPSKKKQKFMENVKNSLHS